MKKIILIIVLIIIGFGISYTYYADDYCNKYSGDNESENIGAIHTLALCKDNIICEPNNIKSIKMNKLNSWECNKKYLPFLNKTFYIEGYNNFNTNTNTNVTK